MFMKLFSSICIILTALNLELIEGVCAPGYNFLQGTCLPAQDVRCPESTVYFNGVCNQITQTTCPTGQISINNCCCQTNCLLNCIHMQACSCCGGLQQWTGQSYGFCNPQLPQPYTIQIGQATSCQNLCTASNTCDLRKTCQQTDLQNCSEPCPPIKSGCDSIPICNATVQTSVCRPVWNNTIVLYPPTTTEKPCVPSNFEYTTTEVAQPATPVAPIRTTTARPAVKCEPGTILIGGKCRLLYCPPGTVLQNNFCTLIRCPYNMVWTGRQCSQLLPIQHNIKFSNTIVNQFNGSREDIVLNYMNNITVDTTYGGSGSELEFGNNETSSEEVTITSTIKPNTALNTLHCCTVKTPRICELRGDRWSCYNRQRYLCGDFCISPIIYLRVPQVEYQHPWMIIPPLMPDCHMNGLCPPVQDYYDCSGCQYGQMEYCSTYCYNYHCPKSHCNFYDQQLYCSEYSQNFGCEIMDGCYSNDWCLDHN